MIGGGKTGDGHRAPKGIHNGDRGYVAGRVRFKGKIGRMVKSCYCRQVIVGSGLIAQAVRACA